MKPPIRLLFLDVEATGVDAEDRLLQVAYKCDGETLNELYKPPVPIKIPAMAVHHVTEKMVADKPAFIGSFAHTRLQELAPHVIFVAHNARYDLGMMKKEGIEFPHHICTMKVARHLDDGQFENHQMQYLRYFYGIEVNAVAHDAFGDIMVLQQVFIKLFDELARKEKLSSSDVIMRMVEISSNPLLIKKINFGKYPRLGITDLAEIAKQDKDYLRWLLSEKLKSPEGEEDWIYSLRHYINN